MKTLFFKSFLVLILISFIGCRDKAKEVETTGAEKAAFANTSAITYKVLNDKSTIVWKGFKPTGSHEGTISISSGLVNVNEESIENGKFIIDMKSIVVTDIPVEKEGNAKLKAHLTSTDFFNVETYPNAKFEVTSIETTVDGKTILSGNLTMKDVTNNIKIPVYTKIKNGVMTLKSEAFTIDRSKWNIKYGSKSFFDDLGDHFINDGIELKVSLVANKVSK